MKIRGGQNLVKFNKMRSNPALGDRRGQFAPESNPIEFDGVGNYGEFATINRGPGSFGSNSLEFEGIANRAFGPVSAVTPWNSTGLEIPAGRQGAPLQP